MSVHARATNSERALVAALVVATTVGLSACSLTGFPTPTSDIVNRPYPHPVLSTRGTEVGRCSWYGPGFHGRKTASGEIYDQNAMTAAHRTLPLGTWIEVTDRASGRRATVRVNDRGPYHSDRVLDVSYAAARNLDMLERGVIDVEIRVLSPGYSSFPQVRYAVQIGAYRSRTQAERQAERVHDLGGRAYVQEVSSPHVMYRVRLGPYWTRPEAAAAKGRFEEHGVRGVIIELVPKRDAGV